MFVTCFFTGNRGYKQLNSLSYSRFWFTGAKWIELEYIPDVWLHTRSLKFNFWCLETLTPVKRWPRSTQTLSEECKNYEHFSSISILRQMMAIRSDHHWYSRKDQSAYSLLIQVQCARRTMPAGWRTDTVTSSASEPSSSHWPTRL